LPDSTFQKLKPYFTLSSQAVRKLNINTATKDELHAHPYIDRKLANVIVEYRNQHGHYQSIDDLQNLILLDEATFQKIRNYLAIE
jgi:competence protein ComEA